MSQYQWQRIQDFLRSVPPFDSLPPEELTEAVSQMEVAYFPRGKVIIEQGGPPSRFLHIIQSGSAKVSLNEAEGGEMLVDIRAERDTFGALSLLQGREALFQVTAREDLICYLLPGEPFKALVQNHPEFERHYSFSLARNLDAVRRSADCQLPHMAGLEGVSLSAALVKSRVGELMSRPVLTCLPMTPVRAAARLMNQRQVGSIVVAEEGLHPVGILTDTNFRVRVATEARSLDQPVADFMSHPVHTVGPDDFAFQALLDMSRHDVHHLVVTEGDRLAGILSDRDLQALTGGSPVGVVRQIDRVDTVDDLVDLHPNIDRVLEMLLRMGGSAKDMLELVTEFNDRVTWKLIELTREEMENRGEGRAPVPFCWMALGSEGRREQTLRTDQDNALVFANVHGERQEKIKAWFLKFAENVVEGLVRCGFPRCEGDVMASNPRWCQPEREWQSIFDHWLTDPNPRTLRLASIFFDFRRIYSEADYLENLETSLAGTLQEHRLFLRHMAKNALYNKAPLGFLRQFVLEKDGEHKNQLNLKLSGLTPLVDGIRVMALDLGVTKTNTLDRLEEVARRGLVKEEMAADLHEAFSFITLLRITRHLEARAAGQVPDNFVDPTSLNTLQRKMLKESFAVINEFQELIEHRYQTRAVMG